MRIAFRIALALVSLGSLASAQDPASGFPCDSDRQPLPEQAAPIETPPSVPPSDPRNPSDARAFEDARREDGKAGSGAEGTSFAGLPGADDSAEETTSDPLTRAQALRERLEREAADAQRARDESKQALLEFRMRASGEGDTAEASRLGNVLDLLTGAADRAERALEEVKRSEAALPRRPVGDRRQELKEGNGRRRLVREGEKENTDEEGTVTIELETDAARERWVAEVLDLLEGTMGQKGAKLGPVYQNSLADALNSLNAAQRSQIAQAAVEQYNQKNPGATLQVDRAQESGDPANNGFYIRTSWSSVQSPALYGSPETGNVGGR